MVIDLQSLSLTSAFNSIVSYFRSQENNTAFRDLSNTSEGSFLIRLLANVISVLSYRIVAQSRENYLSTAALTSSNVGIAVNLGYSVFRGSNLKRLVYLTPTGTYTLPKFSVIGNYNDEYNIITLEDIDLVEGVQAKINTVVGNVREESFVAGTSAIKIFSLFTTGISEDYVLFKDADEVPTTKVMKEMVDDKYLVRTNPYSSVDIAYLNTFSNAKYKYGNGTEFTIRYVELADVPVIPYTSSMFLYGNLDDYTTTSPFLTFEPVDSIKITAPLDHETQNLIRSKADYANRLQQIIPDINEVNFRAMTPTLTQITYLKDDFTLLTGTLLQPGSSKQNIDALEGTEINKVNSLLKQENYFGTPLPDITPPRREVADLDISLALTNKYKSLADINLDIENILKNYYNVYLDNSFSTYDLERKLEGLSYVKYARVSHKINQRKTNTNYQLGHLIYQDGSYYKASKVLGRTSYSQPSEGWAVPLNPGNEIDTNAVILDGTIYWKCFKKLPNMPTSSYFKRVPNMLCGIGDYMYTDLFPNYMFKCIDIVRQTGNSTPDLSASSIGDFVVDGGIVWVVKERVNDSVVKNWDSLTSFRLGETVNVSGAEFSLECISYTGTTGPKETLEFEKNEYDIIGYDEETRDAFYVNGDKTWYFRAGESIEAQDSQGYTSFLVEASIIEGDKTKIIVSRRQSSGEYAIPEGRDYKKLYTTLRGTQDESILWTLVDDINDIDYDWNSFVSFSHSLTILE